MQLPPSLFSQITGSLHAAEFARAASEYPGAKPPRGLSAYDHFLALCFGQLTYRESLRDIVACLNSRPRLLYHMGFRGRLTRTNLAYGNQHRDWRLFQSVAQVLMRRAATLYQSDPGDRDLPQVAFALDSSIISLSLALFPWGYYARSRQAAVKLHVLLSLRGNLPAWAVVTQPQVGDLRLLEEIPLYPGAHYVMDRGYMDFVRLRRLHDNGVFFVVRCKEPVRFEVLERRPVDGGSGFKCDQTVRLSGSWSKKSFTEPLRKIRIFDKENGVMLVLLTNNFLAAPEVIAQLYRRRWQVELFFKWMKQHLRVRAFYGRSQNAVRCQIWCAICAYLLVAIFKKQTGIEQSLNEILQICSVNIFEQVPAMEIFANKTEALTSSQNENDFQNLLPLNEI
jgi:DDE family transposase/uncharacterized protein DUF4372